MIKYLHSTLSSPESLNVNNLSIGALIPSYQLFRPLLVLSVHPRSHKCRRKTRSFWHLIQFGSTWDRLMYRWSHSCGTFRSLFEPIKFYCMPGMSHWCIFLLHWGLSLQCGSLVRLSWILVAPSFRDCWTLRGPSYLHLLV